VKQSIANDMRLPDVVMKPYPQMSIEDFNHWIAKLGEYYSYADHEFIMDAMINDEFSTDTELSAHLISNGANPDFIAELITMRAYFWDFKYSQHINL